LFRLWIACAVLRLPKSAPSELPFTDQFQAAARPLVTLAMSAGFAC
jgi:hypothetical protein